MLILLLSKRVIMEDFFFQFLVRESNSRFLDWKSSTPVFNTDPLSVSIPSEQISYFKGSDFAEHDRNRTNHLPHKMRNP